MSKTLVTRRVRYALNRAQTPPFCAGNMLSKISHGKGAGRKHVDACGWTHKNETDAMPLACSGWDPECCDVCHWCPNHIDALQGNGWSLGQANKDSNPTIGDLFAA